MNEESRLPSADTVAASLAPVEEGHQTPKTFGSDISDWHSRAMTLVRRLGALAWLCVILPTLASTLYFGFLASDVYISESQFVVRSAKKSTSTSLGGLLESTGFGTANEEVRAAQSYIISRDGLRALENDGVARRAWANESVFLFDRFNPLGVYDSFEELFKYYRGKVDAYFDRETGITTLSVKAFSAEDAEVMNHTLLERAENLVNDLNERSQDDLVRYAEREVSEAQDSARDAALALADYRNKEGIIDPEVQANVQLQMISKLQDELIGARMQLLQISTVADENPQIPLLRVRIDGLERTIEEQMSTVAGSGGSLSAAAVQFERLALEREFADRQLAASLVTLQDARNEARRQRVYVERVSQPSRPDDALEPRRLRGILATLVVGLIAWGILVMLLAGVREHRN